MDEEAIRARSERAIEEGVFPGCVIGVVNTNGARNIWPIGRLTYEGNSLAVSTETIYDLASVTKSIPLASLALLFAAEGKLDLKALVRAYVPELQNDYDATVEDLLLYRVKGPRLSTLQHETFEEIRTHVFEHGFDGPPSGHEYTNLPAYILGIILERVGKAIIPALAHRYFFESLQMTDTSFFPKDFTRIAPTEINDGREVRGLVHDESARVFARARRAVGHAGLFSTAPDLLNFLEALLQGKFPAIVDGAKKGFGWSLDETWRQSLSNKHMFSKTGFTGTVVVVDPQQGIGLVILSNRTYPHRPHNTSAINMFRRDIAGIVLA